MEQNVRCIVSLIVAVLVPVTGWSSECCHQRAFQVAGQQCTGTCTRGRIPQEGFLAGTSIATDEISEPIETVTQQGDIQTAASYLVPGYTEVVADNVTLRVASDQRVWVCEGAAWKAAGDLRVGDTLQTEHGPKRVTHVAYHKRLERAYCITTRSGELAACGVRAHNADAATGTVIIGGFAAANPVSILVGSTIGLGVAGWWLYKQYGSRGFCDDNLERVTGKVRNGNCRFTRTDYEDWYYARRKRSLEQVKQCFLRAKEHVMQVDVPGSNTGSFAHQLFSWMTPFSRDIQDMIRTARATTDTSYDRRHLLEEREQELLDLEAEITGLQHDLVFHADELVQRFHEAFEHLRVETNAANQATAEWNAQSDRPGGVLFDVASAYNEGVQRSWYALEEAERACDELEAVVDYYMYHPDGRYVAQTTSIAYVRDDLKASLARKREHLASQRSVLEQNDNGAFGYMASFDGGGIYDRIGGRIKRDYDAEREEREKQYWHQAKKRRKKTQSLAPQTTSTKTSGKNEPCICGCGCPDKSLCIPACGCSSGKQNYDKEKHPHGLYHDADYHHKNSKGKKSPAPKNGQKALDNSVLEKKKGVRRVGISNKQFVVLCWTQEGEYHGHVRTWNELTEDMQKALQRANMVDKKGKIICTD